MTATYRPPIQDIKFLLHDVLKAEERTQSLSTAVPADTADMMLDMVGDYVKKIAFPLNAVGDREGAQFRLQRENDVFTVKMKPGVSPAAFDDYFHGAAKALGQELNAFRPHATEPDTFVIVRDSATSNEKFQEAFEKALQWHEDVEKVDYKAGKSLGYGTVSAPTGFKEGYKEFAELGLVGLLGEEQYGGMNMPHYLVSAANEMLNANFSLAAYPGLTAGAAQVLNVFATDELKEKFLPNFYSGKWSCSMCLTEPNAGSDLGLVNSKAEPAEDGTYKISGNKIFITGGKHDLLDPETGVICHLVLARLPGAPAGTKGISLFLVPENKLDDANNVTAENNGVRCTNIEHKMGIKGSATCALSFEGAEGYLIGEPHKGMDAMFVMMNDERVNVFGQGLTIAEEAMQSAVVYSTERVQGQRITEKFNRSAPSVAIIEHANIRKDIVDMASQIMGWRALGMETTIQLDISKHHPDEAQRKQAKAFVELMTPVLKSGGSDLATAVSQRAIQMHGGMGYITETGVEQFYRDALIATIYEGTNDIQSHDFTFRKMPEHLMSVAKGMQKEMMGMIMGNPALMPYAAAMQEAAATFEKSSGPIADKLQQVNAAFKDMANKDGNGNKMSPEERKEKINLLNDVLVHSRDFMDMFGKMAVGAMWLKILDKALPLAESEPANQATFKNYKHLGAHYLNNVMLPEMKKNGLRIKAGAENVYKVDVKGVVPGL